MLGGFIKFFLKKFFFIIAFLVLLVLEAILEWVFDSIFNFAESKLRNLKKRQSPKSIKRLNQLTVFLFYSAIFSFGYACFQHKVTTPKEEKVCDIPAHEDTSTTKVRTTSKCLIIVKESSNTIRNWFLVAGSAFSIFSLVGFFFWSIKTDSPPSSPQKPTAT